MPFDQFSMTLTQQMEQWTRNLIAWSFDAKACPARYLKRYRNGYGTTYEFVDGSKGFVAKGTAQLIAR